MWALEIRLNGKKHCIAGIQQDGVVTAIACVQTKDGKAWSDLRVGGLESSTEDNIKWLDREIRNGDLISIRVIETAKVDKPSSRQRYDAKKDLANQKKYIRRMAKLFGWKLVK